MTTYHATFQTTPTADGFTLGNPTIGSPATLTALATGGYQINLPQRGDSVDICVTGFNVGSVVYSLTAISVVAGRPDTTWQRRGADALSPVFSENADHLVELTATPNDGSAPRKLPPVTTKIRQPGKPDDFLSQFTPR